MMQNKTISTATAGKMKKGVTIIELSIVLVIAGIVAIAAFTGYNKIYLPTKADSIYKQMASVFSGVERSQALNGGVYPLGVSAAITTVPRLMNVMGGANGVRDVGTWTYDCAAGGSATITIETATFDDAVVTALVVDLINSNNDNWTGVIGATAGATAVTATKANATCG